MTTTLAIDKNIRDKAYLRAKADKISLSAVARMLLSDYADGRISIGTRLNKNSFEEIEVNNEIQNKMDNLSALWNSVGK